MLGINSDQSQEVLKQVMAKEQITWRSWFDGGGVTGPVASAWNVQSWPTIYVLDHKGVIRYRDVREHALDEAVDRLLKELGQEKGAKQ